MADPRMRARTCSPESGPAVPKCGPPSSEGAGGPATVTAVAAAAYPQSPPGLQAPAPVGVAHAGRRALRSNEGVWPETAADAAGEQPRRRIPREL